MQNTWEETRREHEDKNLIEQIVAGKDRNMKSSKEEDMEIKRSEEDDRGFKITEEEDRDYKSTKVQQKRIIKFIFQRERG